MPDGCNSGTGPLVVGMRIARHRRALGAPRRSKFAPGFRPMLHTACRTLHGACTPHIAHCQCMRNTLSLACSIVGTLRPVFLVPSPAPRSRVPIGTVSTQIASRRHALYPQSALLVPVRAAAPPQCPLFAPSVQPTTSSAPFSARSAHSRPRRCCSYTCRGYLVRVVNVAR